MTNESILYLNIYKFYRICHGKVTYVQPTFHILKFVREWAHGGIKLKFKS